MRKSIRFLDSTLSDAYLYGKEHLCGENVYIISVFDRFRD